MDAADFCSLTDYKRTYPMHGPASGPLRDAFDAFLSNVERAHNLGDIPQLVAGSTTIAQTFECVSLADINKFAESPLIAGLNDQRLNPDSPEFDEVVYMKKEETRLRYLNQFLEKMAEGKTTSFQVFKRDGLSFLLEAENPKLVSGLNTILQSVVVEMWTSLEVLAEMIWEGISNIKPGFGQGIALNRHRKDHNLQVDRKTGFRSLDAISFTYELGFSGSPGIMNILNDKRLLALSSVRNLLVHKNGVVDSVFQKRQTLLKGEPCFAPFVSVAFGDKIELSGSSVRDLKNPAIDLGFDLVSEADLWLRINP